MTNNRTLLEIVILCVAASFVMSAILLGGYMVIGIITGVFGGMCSFAPGWWVKMYVNIFFLIPVLGIIAGIFTGLKIAKVLIDPSPKLK